MKLTELRRIIRGNQSNLNYYARQGRFKTARKELDDHRQVWVLDDDEALEYIEQHEIKNDK
jgi:hypothetical protein